MNSQKNATNSNNCGFTSINFGTVGGTIETSATPYRLNVFVNTFNSNPESTVSLDVSLDGGYIGGNTGGSFQVDQKVGVGVHTITVNTTTTCPSGTAQYYTEQEFYTIELVAPSLPDAESPETGEIICTPSESSTPPVIAVNFNFENGPIYDDDFLAQAQVDDNSNFSSPEIDLTYVNSGTISSFLPEDFDGQSKDFYWRVRGKNEAGYGPWTDPIRFTLIHRPSCN